VVLPPPPSDTRPLTIQGGHEFAELAQRATLEQLTKASAFQAALIVSGHFDYRDIFPDDPPIVLDWCARMIPNNIATKEASFIDLESASH
jgi:hypothetical protein